MNLSKSHPRFRLPKVVLACAVAALVCVSCGKDDDVEPAAVVGHWQGTQAVIRVQLDGTALPYEQTDDDFNPVVEFRGDGTMRLEQNGNTRTGNYTISGNTLTIRSLPFETSYLTVYGEYTVLEASTTTLVLETNKHDSAVDPQTGLKITGQVKATLRFSKIMG